MQFRFLSLVGDDNCFIFLPDQTLNQLRDFVAFFFPRLKVSDNAIKESGL